MQLNKHQIAVHSISLAHIAIERLFPVRVSIVKGMATAKTHTAPGIEFAVIPPKLVPQELRVFQKQAISIGVELEFELIRLIGEVPRHYHRRSGGTIVKCESTLEDTLGIFDYFGKGKKTMWQPVKTGEIKFVPAGMVHALRFDRDNRVGPSEVVHILSVNTPPIHPKDTVYV